MPEDEEGAQEPRYDVVWPLGPVQQGAVRAASPRSGLGGHRVAFVWDYLFRGPEMFSIIEAEWRKADATTEFIDYEVFGSIGTSTPEGAGNLKLLGQRLHDHGADYAIVGVGACGACMPACVRAAAACEAAGVTAIVIGATGFEKLGHIVARLKGIDYLPIAVYPGVVLSDTSETFTERVRETVWPEIEQLVRAGRTSDAVTAPASADTGPAPRDIVLSGSFDDVQERFTEWLWTDGLPIVPPTRRRVDAFLAFTDRDADDVVAVLPPENRNATVWNIAVNGVMAGCRPEYLPVLIAVVECLADPVFRLEDQGSTSGREPLITISGPLVRQLDFNRGTGVMRLGRQANSTVARFARLVMRNLGGLRIPPGDQDHGAFGCGFLVTLAEDLEATAAVGWASYGVDRGFAAGDTVVTLQSVVNGSAPIYSAGESADEHLSSISLLFGEAMGPRAMTGLLKDAWYPLLVLGPSVARTLVEFGCGKQKIREYLHRNTRMAASTMEHYVWLAGGVKVTLAELSAEGRIPPGYADSADPERLVPMFLDPAWIGIMIAGNPNRNQSRAYVTDHVGGPPPARRVVLPAAWEELRGRRG
jgi:hypothetical protein